MTTSMITGESLLTSFMQDIKDSAGTAQGDVHKDFPSLDGEEKSSFTTYGSTVEKLIKIQQQLGRENQ